MFIKFICSEKATNFWDISTVVWPLLQRPNLRWRFSQKFVAFSEYMNFIRLNYVNFHIFQEFLVLLYRIIVWTSKYQKYCCFCTYFWKIRLKSSTQIPLRIEVTNVHKVNWLWSELIIKYFEFPCLLILQGF